MAFYHDLIKEGIVLSDEPPFSIDYRSKYLEKIYDEPFAYDICIPCRYDQKGAVLEKGYEAIFMLYYGDYSAMREALDKLVDYILDNDIKVISYPRLSTITTTTLGENIDPDNYFSVVAIPIGDKR